MRIIHIASEIAPIAKVGGLGDVVYSLAHALQDLGHEVVVFIPKYDCLELSALKDLKPISKNFTVEYRDGKIENTIWEARLGKVKIVLMDPDASCDFFKRGMIYCCPDDIERFLYFSKAASDYVTSNSDFDIVHLHDWPVAFVSYFNKVKAIKKTVFTIHNLEHQGLTPPELLFKYSASSPLSQECFDLKYQGTVNLLKMALEYSDAITTVSPSYEKEIQTKEGGCGLESVLVQHKTKLTGILNGIDLAYYNPEEDKALYHPFNKEARHSDEVLLKDKKANKEAFFKAAGKPKKDKFTLAAVTRIARQKAPELIAYALEKTVALGGRFLLLGSLHGNDYREFFQDLAKKYENHPDVLIFLNKDDALAHRIYASSDTLIIPSLFEPCGLTQMIAMRYGTVPLARKTGGLADTVFDIDTSEKPENERNGFTFDFPDTKGIDWVIERAYKLYTNHPTSWAMIAKRCMNIDHSWNKSAEKYLKLYASLSARLI